MQSFHQQNSALPLAAVHVFPLHSLWFCALAENCLGLHLSPVPQPSASVVAVISDGSSPLGGGCEERKFNYKYVDSIKNHKLACNG